MTNPFQKHIAALQQKIESQALHEDAAASAEIEKKTLLAYFLEQAQEAGLPLRIECQDYINFNDSQLYRIIPAGSENHIAFACLDPLNQPPVPQNFDAATVGGYDFKLHLKQDDTFALVLCHVSCGTLANIDPYKFFAAKALTALPPIAAFSAIRTMHP